MFETAKTHLKEHKKIYIAAGLGLVIGGVGVSIMGSSKIIQTAVTHGDHSPILQYAQPIRRGHPGFIVQVKETGEVFPSMKRAQEVLNVSHRKLQDLVDIVGIAQ